MVTRIYVLAASLNDVNAKGRGWLIAGTNRYSTGVEFQQSNKQCRLVVACVLCCVYCCLLLVLLSFPPLSELSELMMMSVSSDVCRSEHSDWSAELFRGFFCGNITFVGGIVRKQRHRVRRRQRRL